MAKRAQPGRAEAERSAPSKRARRAEQESPIGRDDGATDEEGRTSADGNDSRGRAPQMRPVVRRHFIDNYTVSGLEDAEVYYM